METYRFHRGKKIMPSTVRKLVDLNLIKPPRFLADNVCYETIMGSVAYGASDDTSDMDIYGFAMPPKEVCFPHTAGYILNFDKNIPAFDQYQQHHISNPTEMKGKGRIYDLTIFSIIKFFYLLRDNNPNVLDSVWTPQECVLHSTKTGNMVRDNKKLFLHKGVYHKLRGYAFSQLHKASSKNVQPGSKRAAIREANDGEDTKFLMHTMRLLSECEQLLQFGDMDLRRDNEYYKAIRRGEVKEKDIRELFSIKEKELEKLYNDSKLPWGPDDTAIKQLLVDCLEEHYGSLSDCIVQPDQAVQALKDIQSILDKNKNILF